MSRIVKNKQKWIPITIQTKGHTQVEAQELMIVGRHKDAYLWVGRGDVCVATFSGRKTLAKFARQLLEQVK